MLNSFPLSHDNLDWSLLIQGSRIAVGLFSPWVNTNLYKSEAESSFGSYLQSFRKLGRYWEKLMGRWDRSRNDASVEIRPKPRSLEPRSIPFQAAKFSISLWMRNYSGNVSWWGATDTIWKRRALGVKTGGRIDALFASYFKSVNLKAIYLKWALGRVAELKWLFKWAEEPMVQWSRVRCWIKSHILAARFRKLVKGLCVEQCNSTKHNYRHSCK